MSRRYTFIMYPLMIHIVCIVNANSVNESLLSLGNENTEKSFQPILALEIWMLYSISDCESESNANCRTDIMFRRFRLGAKGEPYSWLNYSIQFSLDRFGEDMYIPEKGAYKGIALWNAHVTLKAMPQSELLNLHMGYYWAGISREFITSPYSIGSLDKTRANWFLRYFITGKGNGIESGIGVGGIKNWQDIGISYRLGVYEPQAYLSAIYSDKLFTGRISISLGQAEQKSYSYVISGNQWGKRKGVTLGVGASAQKNGAISDSLFFDKSYAYGADVLINFFGLQVDGEYFTFIRESGGISRYAGLQWHIRLGYSFVVAGKYIEPTLSIDSYSGEGNEKLYEFIGFDNTIDIGINWYLNKDKLKLALHYVAQSSNFSQSGDYFGAAFQFKL